MRFRRGLGGLAAHPSGEKAPDRTEAENIVEQPGPRALQPAGHGVLHRIEHVPLLRHGVDQPERFRLPRIDGLAGQHQRHRLHWIDQLGKSHGTAEAGMQAEHHFGETKPRVLDRYPHLAGQRYLQAAAEAEAVDHGDARNPQGLEPVDHRMRAADLGLDDARIGRAAKRIDVGASNEAGFLGRTDDEAGGAVAFQLRQHLVELLDQVGREGIGAGALAVEQKPGNAVGIAGQLEVPVRAGGIGLRPEFEHAIAENVHDLAIHAHTISISIAPPCPPPMHSVAMPRRVPSRFMALTRCSTMRLPLQPTG